MNASTPQNQSAKKTKQKPYGTEDGSFQAAGGEAGIRQLVDDFYHAMETLPEAKIIFDMHTEDLTILRDKLSRFLCGWLGGPKLFREKYGPIAIPKAHRHLAIGAQERDSWLKCMEVALNKQPYPEDFKTYLLEQLYVPAERSRNQD